MFLGTVFIREPPLKKKTCEDKNGGTIEGYKLFGCLHLKKDVRRNGS